ncbi:flagellar biosynthetic protein FliR [Betaproteobacteria bacterium]|nr:flagellar biosynthetic protein FliR [Betaproteobacteria bacterium]GHU04791.1 flagellar biosynthetic protein FliR [Betaproteobacteria bacterium]GHU18924.1 flagellar biosynthetic protein FliR [Betaproteobacteria bacterium]
MLVITSAQLDAWLAAMIFPLARLLGLLASAPVFSNRATPRRIRLATGVGISLAILPMLPPMPPVVPGSGLGILIMIEQIFIGTAIGMTARLIFATIDLASSVIGMQMGLSFALFFDPNSGGQSSVLADFLSLIATLLFLAVDGHLVLISLLVHSFEWVPVGISLRGEGWSHIPRAASAIFSAGFLLALPLLAVLLVTNISMGVLTRASPQLNLFAIGFPITMAAGYFSLGLILSNFGPVITRLFERFFIIITVMLEALGPG